VEKEIQTSIICKCNSLKFRLLTAVRLTAVSSLILGVKNEAKGGKKETLPLRNKKCETKPDRLVGIAAGSLSFFRQVTRKPEATKSSIKKRESSKESP
jgi:hypothetical protein